MVNNVDKEYSFYNFSKKPADLSVHVTKGKPVPPQELTEAERRMIEFEKDQMERVRRAKNRVGNSQKQKRAERKKKLAHLIKTEKNLTLEEASIYLDVTKETVNRYLKELGMTLKR